MAAMAAAPDGVADAVADEAATGGAAAADAAPAAPATGWLAVDCAGLGLLLPLDQAGEIIEPVGLVRLPHARPWVRGLANLRGTVLCAIDLAGWLGLRSSAEMVGVPAEGVRLVALPQAPDAAASAMRPALWIDRLEGMRHAGAMTPTDGPEVMPAFARGAWRDTRGRSWLALDLVRLAEAPGFRAIAAPA